jgi:hypothetical protein
MKTEDFSKHLQKAGHFQTLQVRDTGTAKRRSSRGAIQMALPIAQVIYFAVLQALRWAISYFSFATIFSRISVPLCLNPSNFSNAFSYFTSAGAEQFVG